jgi:hypothetical protein
VGKNIYSQGEKIQIPVHIINDQYLDFPKARVSWKLVEETDSFVIRGRKPKNATLSLDNMHLAAAIKAMRQKPIAVIVGHQEPKATVLSGQTVADLGPDASLVAAVVSFDAPRTSESRHFTLYLKLESSDGKVLSENFEHFMVVDDSKKFDAPEGISPTPRFNLELALKKSGAPISGPALVVDKYNPQNKYEASLDQRGSAKLSGILPGIYCVSASGETFEFALNKDEKVAVDFKPGIRARLGETPIIGWQKELLRP